jgi:hypothetical protein
MEREVPLQKDMFSGELVDNRTRQQRQNDKKLERPTQTEMFRHGEIAQFGVRAHPQFSLSSTTKLVLVSEDPRTEEEKERDLQHEAEKLTYALFDASGENTQEGTVDDEQKIEVDDAEDTETVVYLSEESKLTIYLELVQLSEERTATLWIDPRYEGAYDTQIGLRVADAQRAGLSDEEITTAIQIGHQRGNAQRHQYERRKNG